MITQKFGDIQESVYRQGDAKDAIYDDGKTKTQLTGTFWARRIVKMFLTYFEQVWFLRNEREHKLGIGVEEKKKIQTYLGKIEDGTYYVPRKLKNFVTKGKRMVKKKSKVSHMKRWISLMTDMQTYQEYRKTMQRKYGSDIKKYIRPGEVRRRRNCGKNSVKLVTDEENKKTCKRYVQLSMFDVKNCSRAFLEMTP